MPRYWILMLLTLALVISAGTAVGGDQPPQPSAGDEPVVVRLYVRDQDHLNAVAGELDIWEVHPDELYVVAAVRPAQYEWLQALGYRLEIDPVKTAQLGILAPLDPRYHYYDDFYPNPNGNHIVDFLRATADDYPHLTELTDIGTAWMGEHGGHVRDIWVLRITNEDPAYGEIEDKPVFYLFATIHAREVATPQLAIRYIEYLTAGYNGEGGYDVDPDVTWLVNHNTLYVLVMQNPDGHWVNEQNVSYPGWRKNMNSNECPAGTFGIDLNRNSSFLWGCCGGSSTNPCSETYRGTERASEPETQAFQAHFASVMTDHNGPNGDDEIPPAAPDDADGIFISLHSYSDLVLWPWGWTTSPAPNGAQLQTIGRKLGYYTGYNPSGFLYKVDGATDDWTYGKFGVASFTFEVGPQYGSCGGFFPAYGCIDGIDGMLRDFWAENKPAFLYAHKIARTPYLTAYGPDTLDVAVTPDDVPQGTPVALTATIADHRYGADPLRPIAAAEYFLNAPGADGTGIPLDPTDGSWGGLTEGVEAVVDTSSLAPGKHTLLVHGQNDQGHWGPLTAVFFEVYVPMPVASFDYLTEGLTVTLTNTSTDADDYEWNLGDGVTSTLEHLVYVYDNAGCYTVTLVAYNDFGSDSWSEEICVCDPVTGVDFMWAPDPGIVGEPILFTASEEITGTAPLVHAWDLGDGATGGGITTTHIYTAEAPYTVTLTVQNSCGEGQTVTKTVYVGAEPRQLSLYLPLMVR